MLLLAVVVGGGGSVDGGFSVHMTSLHPSGSDKADTPFVDNIGQARVMHPPLVTSLVRLGS